MAAFLDSLNSGLGLAVLACLLLGLLCLLLAAVQLRRRRLFLSLSQGLLAVLLLGGAIVLLLLGTNLQTYQRLTYEQPVAQLSFTQLGPQQYRARVRLPDRDQGFRFQLDGDEWQLDARVIKWRPPANLLGLDARYRLERLSGRYRDLHQQRERPQSVYGLAANEGLDVWETLRGMQRYLDWVDTYYGSAAYLPMADGARFEVVLTQTGVVARPLNEAAEQAVRGW